MRDLKYRLAVIAIFLIGFGSFVYGAGPFGSSGGPTVAPLNKVSRSGDTMSGPLNWNGTSTAPSNQGIYERQNGTLSVGIGAVNIWEFASTQMYPATSGYNIGAAGNVVGNVVANGTYTTSIASGSNGFACTVNGCRFDLGTGANDFLVSSGGTNIQMGGGGFDFAIVSGTVTLNGTSAALVYSGTGSHDLTSGINAATATSSVPAWSMTPSNTLDANDLLFAVRSATPTNIFTVDAEGDVSTTGSNITSTAIDATFLISAATADATTSATVAAITLKETASLTAGDFVLNVQDASANSLLAVSTAGALKVNNAYGSSRQVLASGGGSTTADSWLTSESMWTATCFAAAGTNSCESDTVPVFQGAWRPAGSGHANVNISCSWAGENTGAGVVVAAIYNCGTTAGACAAPTTLCSCTIDADCTTTSAGRPMSCDCSGTYTAGSYYMMSFTTATTCATNSPGQVVCNMDVGL